MSNLKPILVHGHPGGPNPWKVILVLEELHLPYKHKIWDFPALKTPDFEKLNPNGRVPAIEDPNTGITLWESGAIVEYLIDRYDEKKSLTYTTSPEKYYVQQWLHFQVSGQGPYFGQRFWFTVYHPEKLPSAIERYGKEIKRVLSVLDRHLATQGTQYLIGEKCTYADLAFVPWNLLLPLAMGEDFEDELRRDLPDYWRWWMRLSERDAVKKVVAQREKTIKEARKG